MSSILSIIFWFWHCLTKKAVSHLIIWSSIGWVVSYCWLRWLRVNPNLWGSTPGQGSAGGRGVSQSSRRSHSGPVADPSCCHRTTDRGLTLANSGWPLTAAPLTQVYPHKLVLTSNHLNHQDETMHRITGQFGNIKNWHDAQLASSLVRSGPACPQNCWAFTYLLRWTFPSPFAIMWRHMTIQGHTVTSCCQIIGSTMFLMPEQV